MANGVPPILPPAPATRSMLHAWVTAARFSVSPLLPGSLRISRDASTSASVLYSSVYIYVLLPVGGSPTMTRPALNNVPTPPSDGAASLNDTVQVPTEFCPQN